MEDDEVVGGNIALYCQDLPVEILVLHNLDQASFLDLLQLEDLEELEVVHVGAKL